MHFRFFIKLGQNSSHFALEYNWVELGLTFVLAEHSHSSHSKSVNVILLLPPSVKLLHI